jgi:hypothetical protein
MSDEGGIVTELAGSSRVGPIRHRQGNEEKGFRHSASHRGYESAGRRHCCEDTSGVVAGSQAFLA